ncbi:MAG: glycerate kinase [Bacteroidales bacterium]|nr:glycerate kinase [Bacteroidales bacterium]
MKLILAIDSFKGCLTSQEANDAAEEGLRLATSGAEIVKMPVSDGGEGWIEAFVAAKGGEVVEVEVLDPLMRPILSQYAICGDTAIVETAKASGLVLLTPEELNPLKASTYGTGQTIVHAINNGCKNVIVGLGGSATSDCGIGMLRALSDFFSDSDIFKLSESQPLKNIHFVIATDVNNPLYGNNGAAHVFAPQKGATPEIVSILDSKAKKFADEMVLHFGYDLSHKPGAGAAGGLGYAFMQFLGADCRSGADLLFDATDFENKISDANLIITGEGSADSQTLMGKLPSVILRRANKFGVPVALLAGKIADREKLLTAGFRHVVSINPPNFPIFEAIKNDIAKKHIRQTVEKIVKVFSE